MLCWLEARAWQILASLHVPDLAAGTKVSANLSFVQARAPQVYKAVEPTSKLDFTYIDCSLILLTCGIKMPRLCKKLSQPNVFARAIAHRGTAETLQGPHFNPQ